MAQKKSTVTKQILQPLALATQIPNSTHKLLRSAGIWEGTRGGRTQFENLKMEKFENWRHAIFCLCEGFWAMG